MEIHVGSTLDIVWLLYNINAVHTHRYLYNAYIMCIY